jgi:integrase/recombinase XerD
LHEITPGIVGDYFDKMVGSPPRRKFHLAALRALFDLFVTRHVMGLNPAASVRGERYQVLEGKTPEVTQQQATRLLQSVNAASLVGLRDRAALGVMIFTAARAAAVARLQLKHFAHDGSQRCWSSRSRVLLWVMVIPYFRRHYTIPVNNRLYRTDTNGPPSILAAIYASS